MDSTMGFVQLMILAMSLVPVRQPIASCRHQANS